MLTLRRGGPREAVSHPSAHGRPVLLATLEVPYDDLLALNHIDDPRKLKIGQKLLIPAKSAKKTE